MALLALKFKPLDSQAQQWGSWASFLKEAAVYLSNPQAQESLAWTTPLILRGCNLSAAVMRGFWVEGGQFL